MAIFCSQCGAENPERNKFCSNCGNAISFIRNSALQQQDIQQEKARKPDEKYSTSLKSPSEKSRNKYKYLLIGGVCAVIIATATFLTWFLFIKKSKSEYSLSEFVSTPRLKKSVELIEIGDFRKSIEINEDEILNNPKNYEAYLLNGHCYLFLGDRDTAMLNYDKAIRINPDIKNEISSFIISETKKRIENINPVDFDNFSYISEYYDKKSRDIFGEILSSEIIRCLNMDDITRCKMLCKCIPNYSAEHIVKVAMGLLEKGKNNILKEKGSHDDSKDILLISANISQKAKLEVGNLFLDLADKFAKDAENEHMVNLYLQLAVEVNPNLSKKVANLFLQKATSLGSSISELQKIYDYAKIASSYDRTSNSDFARLLIQIIEQNYRDVDVEFLINVLKKILEMDSSLLSKCSDIPLKKLAILLKKDNFDVDDVSRLSDFVYLVLPEMKHKISELILTELSNNHFMNLKSLGKQRFNLLYNKIEKFGVSETMSMAPEWRFVKALILYSSADSRKIDETNNQKRYAALVEMKKIKEKFPNSSAAIAISKILPLPEPREIVEDFSNVKSTQRDFVFSLTKINITSSGIEIYCDVNNTSGYTDYLRFYSETLPYLIDDCGQKIVATNIIPATKEENGGYSLRVVPGPGNKFAICFPNISPGSNGFLFSIGSASKKSYYDDFHWAWIKTGLKKDPFEE